mgnify:CR=1 FL=1
MTRNTGELETLDDRAMSRNGYHSKDSWVDTQIQNHSTKKSNRMMKQEDREPLISCKFLFPTSNKGLGLEEVDHNHND